MTKQTDKKMKVEFSNVVSIGHQTSFEPMEPVPPPPRVRFSSLPCDETHVSNPVKARYVKQSQEIDSGVLENVKKTFPGVDSKLNVDHQHYEQWARVPNKRFTNTILFRGIQQLKARVKRDGSEEEDRPYLYSRQLQSRDVATREINTANPSLRETTQKESLPKIVSMKDIRLVQKDTVTKEPSSKDTQLENVVSKKDTPPRQEPPPRQGTSKDKDKPGAKVSRVSLKFKYIENPDGQTSGVRRQPMFPSASVESGFSRSLSSIRHPVKEGEHGHESKVSEQNEKPKSDLDNLAKLENYVHKDNTRQRYGTSKLRERSPFPVSIKQPKYYGEPAYLLSEPFKHRELPKSKTRLDYSVDNTTKSEYLKQDMPYVATKFEVMEFKLPADAALLQEEFYRSKSFMASFPSKKQQASRTPASVSNADFCDISQLEENKHRHSAYNNLLERTRTDSAFSCKTPHLLKWVPRVQRMKELLK